MLEVDAVFVHVRAKTGDRVRELEVSGKLRDNAMEDRVLIGEISVVPKPVCAAALLRCIASRRTALSWAVIAASSAAIRCRLKLSW